MGTEDSVTIERPPFGTVFRVTSEQFGLEVVRAALQHRPHATTSRPASYAPPKTKPRRRSQR